MEQPEFLNEIVIFLIAAVSLVSLLLWLRVSSIVGYLIAGVLIGPHAFAVVKDVEGATLLGQLGVVFLLFTIGLKVPLRRLQMLKRYVFGFGALQVLVTGALLALLARSLGLTIETSILVGSGLALSSTAVGVQILTERGEMATKFGRVTFSVLLFQDLAVVVLLVLLTTLGQEGGDVIHELGFAALKAICVFGLIFVVGRLILRPLYRTIASIDNSELFIAFTLLVVLTTSVATAFAGLSMELGAFLAGILLSETEYRHQVEADIHPFRGLLLGLFFMSIGMSIDLHMVLAHWWAISILVIGLLLVKMSLIICIGRVLSLPLITSLRAGLLLAGAGEFIFILFAMAVEQGLMPYSIAQILFVVAALTMGVTPFLDRVGRLLVKRVKDHQGDVAVQAAMTELDDLRNHVIIVGFGRVGRLVARLLAERMIPFVAIDKDMNSVNEGRAYGLPVYYGDARRIQVMKALGADSAKSIIIGLGTTKSSLRAALMARRHFKGADICVRMPDATHKAALNQVGVHVIMPETLEPSLQLAGAVLQSLGRSEAEITQAVESLRRSLTSAVDVVETQEEKVV